MRGSWTVALLLLVACAKAPERPVPERLVVEPGGLLLGPGETGTLVARALDAQGQPVETAITWASDAPELAVVDAAGRVSAGGALGQAHVVATTPEGLRSAPVTVTVARLAAGVTLYDDAQVVSAPGRSASAPDGGIVGGRYQLALRDAATLPPGSLLAPRGTSRLAGRVVSASVADDVTTLELEVVPLTAFFDGLHLSYTGPLELPVTPGTSMQPLEFNLGPFSCEAMGPELAVEPTLTHSVDSALTYEWSLDLELGAVKAMVVRVDGTVTATLGGEVEFFPDLKGEVSCTRKLRSFPIPVTGVAAWLVAPSVPLTAGFDLAGEANTRLAFGATGTVTAQGSLGFTYQQGSPLQPLAGFTITHGVEPAATVPSPDLLRVQGSAHAYAGLALSLESFLADAAWEALALKSGPKLSADLATPLFQAKDPAYRSSYRLAVHTEAGPGEGLGAFLEYVGLSEAAAFSFEHDVPLAESPRGALRMDPPAIQGGDESVATVALVPETLPFLVTGYNVRQVHVLEATGAADGGVGALEPRGVLAPAMAGQATFSWGWRSLPTDTGTHRFAAFTESKLLPGVLLEVTEDSLRGVTVCPSAEVTHAGGTFTGDLELAAIAGVTHVTGDLSISNATSLGALRCLKTVDGGLVVRDSAVPAIEVPSLATVGFIYFFNNPLATSVSLPLLTSAQSLLVSTNAALTTLSAPLLVSLPGELGIIGNDALARVTGLPALASVGGLVLEGAGLEDVSGLAALKAVAGLLTVQSSDTISPRLATFRLPALETLGGLVVRGSAGPLRTVDLPALTTIGSLTTNSGELEVTDSTISSLLLPRLASVGRNVTFRVFSPTLTVQTAPGLVVGDTFTVNGCNPLDGARPGLAVLSLNLARARVLAVVANTALRSLVLTGLTTIDQDVQISDNRGFPVSGFPAGPFTVGRDVEVHINQGVSDTDAMTWANTLTVVRSRNVSGNTP